MISDVLSEAHDEIEKWLTDFPEIYKSLRPRLEQLLEEMEAIRVRLDTPPDGPKGLPLDHSSWPEHIRRNIGPRTDGEA